MNAITISTQKPEGLYQLVIGIEEGQKHTELTDFSDAQLALLKIDAKPKSISVVGKDFGSLIAVGIADRKKLKDFGATGVRAATSEQPLVFDLRGYAPQEIADVALGALIGGKTKTAYKKKHDAPSSITLLVDEGVTPDLADVEVLAHDVVMVRELINTPANDLWPERLAEIVEEHFKKTKVETEVWDEKRLEKENCGGILAVGKGSARGPRLVIMRYRGGGKHLGLVGKGITFDTGGLSLKPADGMVGMKYDMAGSATVFGAMSAIAKLGLKVDVTAVMAIAENMPSGQATRPGDVITMRNGKTVEVINTDAEGRLVLGDGLDVLAEYKPDHIVDVATLTGAATIALGNRYAGVMGHGAAIEHMLEAAKEAEELLWHMPLPEELKQVLDSDIADMTNAKVGNRAGGMLVGGWFLSEYVDPEQSWAHLDIAGPANNAGSAYSVNPPGATAIMLRSLVEMARKLAAN
ncbi:MAG TPA: leucyl aminopeptidase [Aquiluna sp.]